MEDLPVVSVDFLLGNDLAGGKVCVQSLSVDASLGVETVDVSDYACSVTHLKVR